MEKKVNYEYHMSPLDSTFPELLEEKIFFGYEQVAPLVYDESYVDLCKSLIADHEIKHANKIFLSAVNKNYVLNSIALWEELKIQLHNVLSIDETFNFEQIEYGFSQEFYSALRYITPSTIPVTFTRPIFSQKGVSGLDVIKIGNFTDSKSEKYKLFTKINVLKCNNLISSCIYNHEITHSQLVSLPNCVCSDFLNIETLPILMEQIFADKLDSTTKTLRYLRNTRLLDMSDYIYKSLTMENLNLMSRMTFDIFVQSILQSINLANIYLTGSERIKREMLAYINMIFNGQRSVEEMLDFYNAHVDNTVKNARILKKID